MLENYVSAKDNSEEKGVFMISIVDVLKQKVILLMVGLIVLLAGVPSLYFYSKYRTAQYRLKNPTAAAAADAKELLGKISKVIQLPTDEEPTIATVSDREKLASQTFFANAQNGDKVLIYTKAKKAILYREATGKIIEVGPVTFGQTNATSSAAAAPPIKFVLLNGTTVVGLTKKMETELKALVNNIEVVDRDNAKSQRYTKTLLVDVSGKNTAEADQLAKKLGIALSPLPAGEATPAADFLIIVGADKK